MLESSTDGSSTRSFSLLSKSIVLFKPNLVLMKCGKLAEYSFAALFITFLYLFYFLLTYNWCFCIFMICSVLNQWPISNALPPFLLQPRALNSSGNHVLKWCRSSHSQEPVLGTCGHLPSCAGGSVQPLPSDSEQEDWTLQTISSQSCTVPEWSSKPHGNLAMLKDSELTHLNVLLPSEKTLRSFASGHMIR